MAQAATSRPRRPPESHRCLESSAYASPACRGDPASPPAFAAAAGGRRGSGRRCLLPRLPPALRPGCPGAVRGPARDDAAVGRAGKPRRLRAVRDVRQALALHGPARLPLDPAGGRRRDAGDRRLDRGAAPDDRRLRDRPRRRQPPVRPRGAVPAAHAAARGRRALRRPLGHRAAAARLQARQGRAARPDRRRRRRRQARAARDPAQPAAAAGPGSGVDDDPLKEGLRFEGVRVLGSTGELQRILDEAEPDEITIAIPSAPGVLRAKIVRAAREPVRPAGGTGQA